MDDFADPRSLRVLIAGPDLRALAPVSNWQSVEVTLTRNEAGAGQIVAPLDGRLYDLAATAGNRVHLYHQGRWFAGGPIETRQYAEKSAVADPLPVNFTTDAAWLAARRTYPNPGLAIGSQTSATYTASGNAETLMRDLVRLNAGPDALTDRQVQGLVLGPLAAVGSTVSVNLPPSGVLADALRDAASAGGGLTFDVQLRTNATTGDPELQFVVWAPADVSGLVRYTRGLGNLTSLSVTHEAPTATVAIVGQEATTSDTGVVTPGLIIERADTSADPGWGRWETWVASTADSTATTGDQTAHMQQDGDLALLDAAEKVTVTAEVLDTPNRRYGVNYRLGDVVGVQPITGPAITDMVTAVKLTADPKTGVQVAPTVGTGDAHVGRALRQRLDQLERALARLQAGR